MNKANYSSVYVNKVEELLDIPTLAQKCKQVLTHAHGFALCAGSGEVADVLKDQKRHMEILMAINAELSTPELRPVKYEIRPYPEAVYVEERSPGKWAVTNGGFVLNKEGDFEYEPMPSSRDDEFLARTRYDSPEEAARAFRNSSKRGT